jgi:hypothetical protein
MERLIQISDALLRQTHLRIVRYLYHRLGWANSLIRIIGAGEWKKHPGATMAI